MTRRERKEHRLAQREEWAAKAQVRAKRRFGAAGAIADQIPLGQPILVGHHSERHARRDQDRIHGNMQRGVEETRLAEHHSAKAAELQRQLECSVFSDDPDVIEALEARIAERTVKIEQFKAVNVAWRKSKGDPQRFAAAAELSVATAARMVQIMEQSPWLRSPMETTSLTAANRRDRQRIEEIRTRET